MRISFLISLSLHMMIAVMMALGGNLFWSSSPKMPLTEIPVEFVPIAKESQGAISKPQVIEKEDVIDQEKLEPKLEEKPQDKPQEKPKPPEKSEPEPKPEEQKPEATPEMKPEKEKPVVKEEADPDGIPDKKKKEIKKEIKKKDVVKAVSVKDLKKTPKKVVKKEAPKKKDKKSKIDDDFEQILKNLDTDPSPSKDGKKTESRGKKKNVTNKLSDEASMSLIDAVNRQISRNWKIDAGVKDIETMVVVLRIKLRIDGTVESAEIAERDKVRMSTDPFYRAFAESAKRTVFESAPYNLPPDMYDQEGGWKELELNFSPLDMLEQVQ